VATITDVKGRPFDYVVTMEDLAQGQRIGNYSIDFMRQGSKVWEVLVPPVHKKKKTPSLTASPTASPTVGDRPDGHDPRDQYVGRKRIDTPVVKTSGPGAVRIAKVRFNCLRLVASVDDPRDSDVYLRQFSLHRRVVPWEEDGDELSQ